MRSIADIHSAPISRLPVEVTELFIQLLPTQSQLSVSRVSKRFHALSLRPIYSNISLRSKSALILCCRTLLTSRRSTTAELVRSLCIDYPQYSSSNCLLAGYYTVLGKALQTLCGLHTLRLLVYDNRLVCILRGSSFPSLRHFECYLTPSPGLLAFLVRHPKITCLQVSPNEDTSGAAEGDEKVLVTLKLPHLEYFTGNVRSLPVLCSASAGLRAAIISWVTMETDPEMVFSALAGASGDNLDVLSCRRRGWNLDLIKSASLRLPNLVSLQINNVLLVDARPEQTYLQEIRRVLPRFMQLQRIKIVCIDYWENGDITCQIDQDFTTVTEWSDACASLTEISLPHSDDLVWYRVTHTVWIPDPRHTAGSAWLYDGVVRKRQHMITPQWSAIVDALRLEEISTASGEQPQRSSSGGAHYDELMDPMAGMRTHLGDILRASNDDNDLPELESEAGSGFGPESETGSEITVAPMASTQTDRER